MRAIFIVLIVGVLVVIGLFATGLLHLNQTQPAQVPSVAVRDGAVVTKGGQAPSFEVETGPVAVGTERRDVNVAVPVVRVNRPADQQPVANTAQ